MQRLRGEVSSRCRRVAVGVAPMGKMAAGFRGDRSAGVGLSHRESGRDPAGTSWLPWFVAGSAVAEGTRGKGMRKWEGDSLTSTSWLRAGLSPACPFWVGARMLPFIPTKLHGDFREPYAPEFRSPSPSLMLSFEGYWE